MDHLQPADFIQRAQFLSLLVKSGEHVNFLCNLQHWPLCNRIHVTNYERILRTEEGLNMAVTVKKIVLWRKETENKAGILANALAPLAHAGTDIHVVMGYRYPGEESKAAIELYPVAGRKSVTAAKEAGFSASAIPALLIEGDNRAGLGYETAQAIADAGINVDFLVAQVVGRKYSAVFGFESDTDATKCAAIIRKATAAKKR
jgi:hypothetical protein